jgi:hypothetical protein
MKQTIHTLLAIIFMAAFTIGKASAKEVIVPKMYMFAFAASFTDTIVHFTNIMEVDSVWVQKKHKFLIGRENYSHQFRDFLAEKKEMPHRTCVIFFNKSRKKLEKQYVKMKRLYTQSKGGQKQFDVRYIYPEEFSFRPIDINVYILAEQERIEQAKEQELQAKQQREAAKKNKKEARKRRKEAKRNKKG